MEKSFAQNLMIILTILIFVFSTNNAFSQTNNDIASCCTGEIGRCTGSSYCTACTNCSRCKYCNSGGSCGVCSDGSRRANTRTTTRSNTYSYPSPSSITTNRSNDTKLKTFTSSNNSNSSEIYYLQNDTYSQYYFKTLMVNTITLNLRKGPSTDFGILEKLNKYQELTFLAMLGDWVKVRVKSTNTIGFVHYKYVVVLNE